MRMHQCTMHQCKVKAFALALAPAALISLGVADATSPRRSGAGKIFFSLCDSVTTVVLDQAAIRRRPSTLRLGRRFQERRCRCDVQQSNRTAPPKTIDAAVSEQQWRTFTCRGDRFYATTDPNPHQTAENKLLRRGYVNNYRKDSTIYFRERMDRYGYDNKPDMGKSYLPPVGSAPDNAPKVSPMMSRDGNNFALCTLGLTPRFRPRAMPSQPLDHFKRGYNERANMRERDIRPHDDGKVSDPYLRSYPAGLDFSLLTHSAAGLQDDHMLSRAAAHANTGDGGG
ncbi:hypothetical protein THAOC_03222, partial [Thalassiosira oceanica]